MKSLFPIIIVALALCACTSTGKFASKTNGPVDVAVTFQNVCSGEKILDGLWQAIVVAANIPADEAKIEKDAHAGALVICSGPVPKDLTGAIAAVLADSAQIAPLVAKYTKPPA